MTTRLVSSIFRWTGRAIAAAFGGFILLFLVGEGIPDLLSGRGNSLILFLPWVCLAIAGAVLAWFKEKIGAVLLIMGGIAMGFFTYGSAVIFVYCLPFVLAGLLILISRANFVKAEPKLKI